MLEGFTINLSEIRMNVSLKCLSGFLKTENRADFSALQVLTESLIHEIHPFFHLVRIHLFQSLLQIQRVSNFLIACQAFFHRYGTSNNFSHAGITGNCQIGRDQ